MPVMGKKSEFNEVTIKENKEKQNSEKREQSLNDDIISITIDKSLVKDEKNGAIKTRVPSTYGDNIRFLWIKKSDCEEINNSKTILTSLDQNNTYKLYNQFGDIAENISGKNLFETYYDPVNIKSSQKKSELPIDSKETVFEKDNTEKSEKTVVDDTNFDLKDVESLSTPILANIYDQSNFKIAKLEDKNTRITAKNEKAQMKIDKAKNFVELFNQIKDPTVAKTVPAPVFKFMEKIAEQKQEKINNLSSKIKKRNNKIANNDKKIAKHTKTLETCKKVDTFLQNMKSPEGRKENFINGLQEFNNIALNKATTKLADVDEKINKASTAYNKTHSASDRLKLKNKIKKLTEQKGVLESKIKGLGGITNRINAVQNASQDKADEVISKSCEGIVNAVTENPDEFAKNQAETVVEVCNTVIDKELPTAELGLGQDKPDNYLKNAEMLVEDDYNSIDGVINNGSKEKEQEKFTEKSSGKDEKRGAFPVSRNKIKQNAEKIAKSEHKTTDDKQKSKGQAL